MLWLIGSLMTYTILCTVHCTQTEKLQSIVANVQKELENLQEHTKFEQKKS